MRFGVDETEEEERTRELTEEVLGDPPGENGDESDAQAGEEADSTVDYIPRSQFEELVGLVEQLEEQIEVIDGIVADMEDRMVRRRLNLIELYEHVEQLSQAEGYDVSWDHFESQENENVTLHSLDVGETPEEVADDTDSVVNRSHRPWEGDTLGGEEE